MSEYFLSLQSYTVKTRYLQKVSIINHFDPYTFTKKDFLTDLKDIPEVNLLDINTYFKYSQFLHK